MPGLINHQKTIIKIKNELTFRKTHHYSVELIHVIEGGLRAFHGGEVYELEAGDVYILFPFEEHSYERIGDNVIMVAIFNPDSVETSRNLFLDFRPESPHIKARELMPGFGESLRRLAELAMVNGSFSNEGHDYDIIRPEYSGYRVSRECVLSYLSSAVEELLGQIKLVPYDTESSSGAQSILTYCAKQLDDVTLSMSAVSAATGYSRGHITKLLTHKMGMNFTELIHKLRTQKARRLLAESEKSVIEIALECGFASQRTFNRVFKSEVGMTPSDFRDKLLRDGHDHNYELGWK